MTQEKRRIIREATAGLDDKEDAQIRISPGEEGSGLVIEVHSKVESMFGDQIRASALEVLEHYGLDDVKVYIVDRSALDYVIRARLRTAIERVLRE